MIKIDRSTLDDTVLGKLPAYVEGRYRADRGMGSGCFMDVPGFPSYFIQHLYYNGNPPSHGPTAVIRDGGGTLRVIDNNEWKPGETHEMHRERFDALMRSIYKPLPFESARVQAWVCHLFTYFKHCYIDEAGKAEPPEYGRPGTLIFPVPSYKLRRFEDDSRFSEAWRAQERAAVEQANADINAAATSVAIFDNHKAVRAIREFYSDVTPETVITIERYVNGVLVRRKVTLASLIVEPDKYGTGDWANVNERMPSPEECDAMESRWRPGPHRTGWCQTCGAIEEA